MDPNNVLEDIALDAEGKLIVSNISASSIALPTGLIVDGEEIAGSLDLGLLTISQSLANANDTISLLQTDVLSIASLAATLDTRVSDLETKEASTAAELAAAKDLAAQAAANADTLDDQVACCLYRSQPVITES
jgi:hypothetical protein